MKVGYLGPKGSFTHSATSQLFSQNNLLSFSTIVEVLEELERGQIEYGVVPIENSIEGTVNPTLDYLYHFSTHQIQGEVILPIIQNVLVHPKWSNHLEEVNLVLSHPQALAQTQLFLSKKFSKIPQKIMDSTTQAAQWISEHPEEAAIAIASKEAAKMYGLNVAFESTQDIETNQTRFWVVGEKPLLLSSSKRKQSICVTMEKNESGNLHKILSAFSWRKIDLLKIESRPLKTALGDYFFLIDINVNNQLLVDMALEEIAELGGKIKILGNYKLY